MIRPLNRIGLCFLCLMALTPVRAAGLRLPSVISDHMVLQQGVPLRIWGWAPAGASVTVELAGKVAVARAGKRGEWVADLPAMPAGGPHELTVSSKETRTISDVMVGEVWIASGQSNMEFYLKNERHAAEELPKADRPEIRFFMMEKTLAMRPAEDARGVWKVCTPDNAGDFSAIGYYFARDVARDTKGAVGVLQNAWGGSAAESWVPMKDLEADPDLKPINDRWRARSAEDRRAVVEGYDYSVEFGNVRFTPKDPGATPIAIPTDGWNASVKPDSTGVLAPGWGAPGGGKSLIFSGNLKTGAWGSVMVQWSPARDLTNYEALELSVRGKGKFNLSLGQPSITDWDYHGSANFDARKDWTDVKIPLASVRQGGWGAPKPFTPHEVTSIRLGISVPYMPEGPEIMYNALVAPIARYAVRGVLWYQGETNCGRSVQYRKLLPALIANWRVTFGNPSMPFYLVQLANYMQRRDVPSEGGWAEMREAQARAMSIPGVGVATAVDLGDAADIHPKEKRELAGRLYRWALRDLYGGQGIVVSGPVFKSMTVTGGKATISFDHVAKGLKAKGKLVGFALAGEDRVFHWAKARIVKDRVELSCPEVPAPVAARYAWADNPAVSLYNSEGLPALPFRTDEWPVTTENAR